MGKILIVIGIAIIVVGLLIQYSGKLPFPGKLPGDIVVDKPNFKMYIPITTSILISVILSLLIYLFNNLKVIEEKQFEGPALS